MAKISTEQGEINVSSNVYTTIAGMAASNCFGVKGMAVRSMTDGLVHLLLTAGLIPAALFLWKHLSIWSVTETSRAFPVTPVDLSIKTVANHPDQPYTTGLLVGALITLISGVLIVLRAMKKPR